MAYVSSADLQEQRNQRIFERQMAAEARAQARRRNFIERNPGMVAPQDRRQALFGNAEDRGGYLAHERDMLGLRTRGALDLEERRGANELAVQQSKNQGLKDVAGIEAEARRFAAEKEWSSRLGIADKELEGKKIAAEKQLEGTIDKNKSSEEIAMIQSEGALGVAKQQGLDALEVEREKTRQAQYAERIRLAQEQQKQTNFETRQTRISDHQREQMVQQRITQLQKDPANRGKTPEELRSMAEAYVNDSIAGGKNPFHAD